ncbi:hypothetical protein, partial [Blautia glucerasea]|uniref:hypothetical protein n=1 Tax=Blautia glucerasea TaxID=536633 RepID=UPI001A9A91BB
RYHVIHGKHHHLFSFFICTFRHHKKHRPSDIYYIRKVVPTIAKPCKSRALSTVCGGLKCSISRPPFRAARPIVTVLLCHQRSY